MIAPLGKGTAELSAHDGRVTLRTHDNRLLHGDNAAELLRRHFGWRLPVAALPYWIRGLPQPEARVDEMVFDERRRLRRLRQSGWEIRYSGYRRVDEYVLPTGLRLESHALRVKLAVTAWILEEPLNEPLREPLREASAETPAEPPQ